MPSNFLQWNPGAVNQEDDLAYQGDGQRTEGSVDNTPFPAALANKLFYQCSTGVKALMDMMKSKGYDVSDQDLDALTGVLANILTNKDIRSNLQQLGYAPNQALDVSKYLGFQLNLAGNSTIQITGLAVGDEIAFIFAQDGVGYHRVTWPGNSSGFVQPDPTPSTISVQIGKVASDLTVRAASPTMSASGINSTPIGAALPATGDFTTLTAHASMTAPTPDAADNSQKVPTTQWCRFGFAINPGANGYIKFPTWLGGLIFMWGYALYGQSPVSFLGSNGMSFPNNCWNVQLTSKQVSGQHSALNSLVAVSTTQFSWQRGGDTSTDGQCPVFWFAIGN